MRDGECFEQSHGVARLQVLGQDEHTGVGVLIADLRGSDNALVGVGRRHADVDDREVGFRVAYESHEFVDVTSFARDLEAGSQE